jgi:hypothetical protein
MLESMCKFFFGKITLTPPMFGETRFVTPYFQLFSTNDTPVQNSQNNSHSAPKMEWSVIYFGVEYQLFWSKCQLVWEFWSGVSFVENKV